MKPLEEEIDRYLKRLFPICRSITGNGNRETLKILQEIIPLEILEYPSGTPVYDWVIPDEWNIRDAWIKNSRGEKIVDFRNSNLHVVGYSGPIRGDYSFSDLQPHLHFREDIPEAIPYRTSYYQRDWGFCLSFKDFSNLFKPEETYQVLIDSQFTKGSLSVGEFLIPGRLKKEFLISTYICHPSMANDNLSGVLLTAFLARTLQQKPLNFSYRIIFAPETIGAIAYCAHHEKQIKSLKSGLIVSTIGGPGRFQLKESFDPENPINFLIKEELKKACEDFEVLPFDIHGSDERQFSSQGFRLNTPVLSRNQFYRYEYYHTSLDDLDFVKPSNLEQSLEIYQGVLEALDKDITLKNQVHHGEVMLGRRDLYPKTGGGIVPGKSSQDELDLILWLNFWCDGTLSLGEISRKTGFSIHDLYSVSQKLVEKGVLKIGGGKSY